jgi:hypothetical protein
MDGPVRFRINGPNVIHETVENEVVIINVNNGAYYGLDNAGAEIWDLIESGTAVDSIVQELARRYGRNAADLEPVVRQLVVQLEEEGLIVADPEAGPFAVPPVAAGMEGVEPASGPFAMPQLRKYTDLQDFILLDPIQDAEETGWPGAQPAPKA